METYKGAETFYARTRLQWRRWLAKYGQKKTEVFLVLYNKNSTQKCISYEEAIEEALCYGWIDSVTNKRDAESRYQRFSPRKPTSKWSQPNRDRVAKLIAQGLMTVQGQKTIDTAKERGTWDPTQ
jgi:uncharacterized protein YdeI (YjbR/CyaY-like superfamily)